MDTSSARSPFRPAPQRAPTPTAAPARRSGATRPPAIAMQALLILSLPPVGVSEQGLRAGDPDALAAWNRSFDWSWGANRKLKGKLGS